MKRPLLLLRWISLQPRRAVLLGATAAVCLAVTLVATWLLGDFGRELAAVVTRTETGDARLVIASDSVTSSALLPAPIDRGAVPGRPMSASEVDHLLTLLDSMQVAASPRIALVARLLPDGREVQLIGADSTAEARVVPEIGRSTTAATTAAAGASAREFAVAASTDPAGLTRVELPATAVTNSANAFVNDRRFYVSRDRLATEVGYAATEIAVRFSDDADPFAASFELERAVAELFPDAVVQPWPELAPEVAYLAGRDAGRLARRLLFALAAIIVGTASTLHVTTRRAELALLQSMGMTAGEAVGLVVGETALVTAAGSVVGCAAAAAVATALEHAGVGLPMALIELAPRLRLVAPIPIGIGALFAPSAILMAVATAAAYLSVRRRLRETLSGRLPWSTS